MAFLGRRGSGVQIAPPRPNLTLCIQRFTARHDCLILPNFIENVSEPYQNPFNRPSPYVRIKTLRRCGLASLPVQLGQRFTLHLQLHLRVLLTHFCVTLPKKLGHPLVSDPASAQASGVGGPQVVQPEVRNTRALECSPPSLLEVDLVPAGIVRTGEEPLAGPASSIWLRNAPTAMSVSGMFGDNSISGIGRNS